MMNKKGQIMEILSIFTFKKYLGKNKGNLESHYPND